VPLSTVAKAALCICPPALMAGTVATVPAAKRLAHHVTAPRHAPKPVHRVKAARPVQPRAQPEVDCVPIVAGLAPALPLVTYAAPVPDESPDGIGGGGIGGSGSAPVIGGIGVAPGTPPVAVVPPVTDPVPGPVPEPSVWLMMIAGVGALGAALRRRRSRKAGDRRHGSAKKAVAGGALWSGSVAVEAGDMAATVAVKSAVASAAGKALLCVCPAAVVAGSVVTVPPLRQAVYAATIPQAPAIPIISVPAPPCNETTTVPVSAASLDGFPASVSTVPESTSATAAIATAAVSPPTKG